ncbi:MAG: gamma carbonic anhydrase family protein [Clostridia bacterium]|nr:gamma carbonic anhydrase family protein [Clostridia bacterium]
MIKKFKEHKPKIHKDSFIAENAVIIGNVKIEKNCSIWYGAVLRGDIEEILIKEGSNIQDNSVLHCSEKLKLIVGKNTTVGHHVTLHSCQIKEGSLIGMGSTILDGAVIGKNCLVGAHSLVTQNTVIPDNSLVMGSPARIKRELSEEEINDIHKNTAEYVRLLEEYMREND